MTIERIGYIEDIVSDFVAKNSGIPAENYTLCFRKYGSADSSLSVIIDCVGKDQKTADTICSLARSRMLHTDYPGRKSSAGNLAFPFSPSDIHVGAVYEFSIFHLAVVDSLSETAEIEIMEVGK